MAGRAGGPRPSGRFLSAGMKAENSVGRATSIQVSGRTAGAAHGAASILPCAMATMAQSSSSLGIVPPCSHACSGVQISAVAMNSQSARDKIPAAKKIRSRVRRLNWRFLYRKSFAVLASYIPAASLIFSINTSPCEAYPTFGQFETATAPKSVSKFVRLSDSPTVSPWQPAPVHCRPRNV